MENPRNKGANTSKKSDVHCPHCSRRWFTAVEVVGLDYKCFKCHRRYLINLDENNLSVKLLSLSEKELEQQKKQK